MAADSLRTGAVAPGTADPGVRHRYDRRVRRYRKAFSALIPTHHKVQLYGDVGLVALGVGWDYGRRDRWATDVMLGYVPKYSSERAKATFTLKQSFTPWSLGLGRSHWAVEPLSSGLFVNTVFNGDFWTHQPSRYPDNYYFFSTRLRFHLFVGQSLTYDIPHDSRKWVKAVSAYYELSSCDLYLISAVGNRTLRPRDFLRLAFGLTFRIF